MSHKLIALAAIAIAALLLASCSGASASTPSPQSTMTTTAPTPTATETSVSPEVTVTVTATSEPTESGTPTEEATPETPTGTETFIGTVVYLKFVEDSSGRCDQPYQTDVVLQVEDNQWGVKGVQFHDPNGEIGQPDSLGHVVRVTVKPGDYHEITLASGDEPFPVTDHCSKGSVPDSVYGYSFLEEMPYNAATWKTLKHW